MILFGSDPDIATIIARIKSGDIDLQPNFQRGEVWAKHKKQKLVDSILREWHVPPIHVIVVGDSKRQEVLDGQQRLAAIRDFEANLFPFDGQLEPLDEGLMEMDGRYYRDLSTNFKRLFDQFTIRLFRITDYSPGEPGELFFRLNQPTSLTGAEQRNAFFGPIREDIKELVDVLHESSIQRILGFKNTRMAFDDVLARASLALTRGSISEKITASNLADFYRSDHRLDRDVKAVLKHAMEVLNHCAEYISDGTALNKATFFSWMMFFARERHSSSLRGRNSDSSHLMGFFGYFEYLMNHRYSDIFRKSGDTTVISGATEWLLLVFVDRSSARVADVSSVLLRDCALWYFYRHYLIEIEEHVDYSHEFSSIMSALEAAGIPNDDILAQILLREGWGALSA